MNVIIVLIVIIVIGIFLWSFFRNRISGNDSRGDGGWYHGSNWDTSHSGGGGDVGGRDMSHNHGYHSDGDIGGHDGGDSGGGGDGGGGGE